MLNKIRNIVQGGFFTPMSWIICLVGRRIHRTDCTSSAISDALPVEDIRAVKFLSSSFAVPIACHTWTVGRPERSVAVAAASLGRSRLVASDQSNRCQQGTADTGSDTAAAAVVAAASCTDFAASGPLALAAAQNSSPHVAVDQWQLAPFCLASLP